MMADGSDDPHLIEPLATKIETGAVVAAPRATRAEVGRLVVDRLSSGASRTAGVSLYWLARLVSRDATNSFKAYSRSFVRDVGIDSRQGFEIGIELVAAPGGPAGA